MGRVMRGQILAGTGPDLEGPGIDRETLKLLFTQIQGHLVGGVCHDLAQRPVVRPFNFRLDELPDGKLVIKADVEVLDEERFSQMGGFSVAFTRCTRRLGTGDKPVARVLINPRFFDFEELSSAISTIVPRGPAVDLTERIEKAAISEIAIIVIVVNLLTEVGKGFLAAAGADIYKFLRGLRRRDNPDAEKRIQIDATTRVSAVPVRFILDLDENVTEQDMRALDIGELEKFVPPGIELQSITRVVGKVTKGPTVILRFIVLEDGTSITLTDSEHKP